MIHRRHGLILSSKLFLIVLLLVVIIASINANDNNKLLHNKIKARRGLNPKPTRNTVHNDDDKDSLLNRKNIITELDKERPTIHLPRKTRERKYGQLVSWTERSDVPGDYEAPIQHPDVTTDIAEEGQKSAEGEVFECADAPDDYYEDDNVDDDVVDNDDNTEDDDDTHVDTNGIQIKQEPGNINRVTIPIMASTKKHKRLVQNHVINNAIKKFSKYDFETGKLFKTNMPHTRICNKTEHELLRIKHHRTKRTLNDELLKLVRGNLDDENLSPRVTISRIRQAIKDKLRQSMITTAEMNGKNAIVNQTKIDELINKSFKKRLHHQFWQQLKTIHGSTTRNKKI